MNEVEVLLTVISVNCVDFFTRDRERVNPVVHELQRARLRNGTPSTVSDEAFWDGRFG